ncbi:uncharacterized protein LOC119171846 isoform X1 [Rhipicephalus microplus]|uniref:uncharacterized protein LOC119171846 isoform X1 n=1 Tax=Rhipicephalus microplus TaxID=6941 RepID=UPI003F6BB9C9
MERQARHYKDSAESAQSAPSTDLPPVEAICKQLDDNLAASAALKVYLRIRPRIGGRAFTDPAFRPLDDRTVESTTATLEHKHQKRFSFTKVFPEGSTQEQLFQEAVQDPVDSFINGANVLLFAYGPTNGGKTYTMQGPPTQPGVVPRTLDRLFRVLGPQVCRGAPVRPDCFDDAVLLSAEEEASALLQKNKLLGEKGARSAADFSTFHLPASESDRSLFASCSSDSSYDDKAQALLWLSFYEIYNEGIYDLLLPSLEAASKKNGGQRRIILKLGEDRAKRSFVRGLIEVPVHSADEAHRLLCLARNNQSIAETQLNRSSSRSHCVFTVRLVSSTVDSRNGSQNWHVNTLMLCDLAGSERPSKAGTDGSRLREAGRINTSLMVLSRCLEGLRNNKDSSKNACVPFRESKLTKVMQAYFTTGGQVSLIVNICPSMSMLEESLNALKFSAVAIEVVPQQLELRHTRCKEAVRRLSERWSRASGAFRGVAVSPIPVEDAATGALDADAAEELFETIEAQQRDLDALERELDDTRRQLAWSQKMAAANEAEVNDYKEMVKELEKSLRTQRDRFDHEIAVRVQNACEITRLEMHRKAERGSPMELLSRLEEAQCQIANLNKELTEQATAQDDSVAEDCRPRPITASVEIQTEDVVIGNSTSAVLHEQVLLSKAESELHNLRSRLEEAQSLLNSERQARKEAEVSAKQALEQHSDFQQRLSVQEVQQQVLKQRLEELQQANDVMQRNAAESSCEFEQMRCDMRERELALDVLREQLDNMAEALREAENKAREEAKHRVSAEERCKAAVEEAVEVRRLACNTEKSLHSAELRLKAAHEELQICQEKLVASEHSRQAAMASVEAKEEEVSRLQQALKSVVAESAAESANENCQHRTRRTTRTTRRTTRAKRSKAESLAPSELSDGDADFKPPRRNPRHTKKSVVPPDDLLEEQEEHRSVLADDNSEASPLRRLGNFVAGMLSMSTSNGVAPSTRNRRQLISVDSDFVELPDQQTPPAARRTTSRRKAKE